MTRLFLAVVMVNVLGLASVAGSLQAPSEPTVAIETTSTDELRATERAWETAQLRLEQACGSDVSGVTGVEEATAISNGYRVRVTATGHCA